MAKALLVTIVTIVSLLTTSASQALVLATPPAFDTNNSDAWFNLAQAIKTSSDKFIQILAYGYGGDVEMLHQFTNAIQDAQIKGKLIEIIVVYPAWSASAMMVCYADKVTFQKDGELNYHRPFEVEYRNGKAIYPKMKDRVYPELDSYELDSFKKCIDKGLLSNEGYANVIDKKGAKYKNGRTILTDNF